MAQDKLEKNGNLFSKIIEKKKEKETGGMLVNMVLASGAGVGAKNTSLYAELAPKRERLKSVDVHAVVDEKPVEVIPPLSSAKELMNRVKLLSNADYTVRDRVDILLNGTAPLHSTSSNVNLNESNVYTQLNEDQIEDIQVADDSGFMYANIMKQNRINLHDLRNVWAYNSTQDSRGNRSIIQKR